MSLYVVPELLPFGLRVEARTVVVRLSHDVKAPILIKLLSVLVQQMRQRIQCEYDLGISLCNSVMHPPKTRLI